MRTAVLILTVASLSFAQDVQEIRDWYGTVHDMMAEEGLYRSSLEINTDEMSYPAVGIYHQSISFHWGLDEENYPDAELLFITVVAQYSVITEYHEYLYDRDGNLMFAFRSGGYEELEERYYFSRGSLMKLTVNGENVEEPLSEHAMEAEAVLQTAEDWMEAFTLIH